MSPCVRNTEPRSTALLLECSSHCQTLKCCSRGWFADFCPVQGPEGFSGVANLGATPPFCARAGGWSLSGWHLRVRYRGRAPG